MTQKCILRRQEVERRCGVARSTIYQWMCKGQFPRRVHLGQRAVGWLASDIEQWIKQRSTAQSDSDE
ncbi:AlpA family transcriptional regulator [Paracoccaceae bacterium]|nr:AlpA family transcriptional regulator [Paracoccaceae bacterium]